MGHSWAISIIDNEGQPVKGISQSPGHNRLFVDNEKEKIQLQQEGVLRAHWNLYYLIKHERVKGFRRKRLSDLLLQFYLYICI